MVTNYLVYIAASTYGCDTYGAGAYGENSCETTTVGAPNTGFFGQNEQTLYLVGGVLLIVIAIVTAFVLVKRRRK